MAGVEGGASVVYRHQIWGSSHCLERRRRRLGSSSREHWWGGAGTVAGEEGWRGGPVAGETPGLQPHADLAENAAVALDLGAAARQFAEDEEESGGEERFVEGPMGREVTGEGMGRRV